ncbi:MULTISPECIES: DUF6634 family protein [Hansschlegelia]|uniref:Uncharacterized protein n=1 Tax=Hansschlegelia zhihuaiae TaxID=405005 RepID=A0A4Q0MEZ9_9HYPH|nr:DUF6634 family protein [Hansschlegelia zhihuaiae]RXF71456.1 hypothetical protein EK403_15410 [Hansschlegelia zhihuaiae]
MTDEKTRQTLCGALRSLRKVAEGASPDLRDAPELRDWLIVSAEDGVALIGRVTGHPTVEDDRLVYTSALIAMSADQSWARTLNRFYRLRGPSRLPR